MKTRKLEGVSILLYSGKGIYMQGLWEFKAHKRLCHGNDGTLEGISNPDI